MVMIIYIEMHMKMLKISLIKNIKEISSLSGKR